MKLITEHLTDEQRVWWCVSDKDNKRRIARSIVNKGIIGNIDFEIWGEVIYYPLYKGSVLKEENNKPIVCEHLLVSNLGRLYSKITNNICDLKKNKGYSLAYSGSSGKNMSVHRLVANVFCPRPKRHKNTPLTELIVNHIDGDKSNNNWYNLEWVNSSENQRHALDTGLKVPLKGINHKKSIPMKGTVVTVKGHEGKVIYVCGGEDYKRFNLEASNLYKVRENKLSIHRGCTWEICSIKDYLSNKKDNCLGLAKAMREHVVKITYVLTDVKTGESKPEMTAREYRDLYGFNETHFQHTWNISGTIKGYTVRKFEDGEEVFSEPKEVVMTHWVLVGIEGKDVIRLMSEGDLITHGFKHNNLKRNVKLNIPARHPETKKLYRVHEFKSILTR